MVLTTIIVVSAVSSAVVASSYWFKTYIDKLKKINQVVSDQELVALARQNKGEVSAALLCEHFGLSLSEADTKINNLLMSGVIEQKYEWDWTDWSSMLEGTKTKYVMKGLPAKHFLPKRQATNVGNIASTSNYQKERGGVSDSEVIGLAVQMKGKVTVSTLCFKLNISVDEAKKKLEELYKKEIFEVNVSENGTLVYILVDRDLYQ
jgi:predicted HTH transcriptional regulator